VVCPSVDRDLYCLVFCADSFTFAHPFTNKVPALAMLFLALGMIEFDGIFILIGYAMVVATTLYRSCTIIWEMLVSWGKLTLAALTFHSGKN